MNPTPATAPAIKEGAAKKVGGPPRKIQPGEHIGPFPQHDVLLAGHWRHQTAANEAYATMNVTRSDDPEAVNVHRDIKAPLRQLLKQVLGVDTLPLPKFWVGADHVANPKHWAHQAQYIKPGTSSTFAIGTHPNLKVYTVYEVSDDGIRFENYINNRRQRGKKPEVAAEAGIPEFIGSNSNETNLAAALSTIVAGRSRDPFTAVPEAQQLKGVAAGLMDADDSDAKPRAKLAAAPSVASNAESMSMSSSALASFPFDVSSFAAEPAIMTFAMETESVTQSSMVPGQSQAGITTATSAQLNSVTMEELESLVAKTSLCPSAMPSRDTIAHSTCATDASMCRFDLGDAYTSWLYGAVIAANSMGVLNVANKMLDANDVVLLIKLLSEFGTKVTHLDLGSNSIGDNGLAAVANWLKTNKASALLNLQINSNGIGDDGSLAFGRALAVNTVLQELDLSYNRISNIGAVAIAEGLEKNQTSAMLCLHMKSNDIGDVGAVAFGKAIAVNTTLQELDISYNKISNIGAVAIAEGLEKNKASALVKLFLRCSDIRDGGAVAFGKALAVNTKLQVLNLAQNKIASAGAVVIAEGIEKNKASALDKLDLSENDIGDDGAEAFGKTLAVNTALQILFLGSNKISSVGAKAIAGVLEKKQSLLKLDLSRDAIGDDGAMAFGRALEENTMLQDLDLALNKFSTAGSVAIANGLEKNKESALVKLVLRQNDIGDGGAEAFGKALSVNTSLQRLDLSYNSIQNIGALAIAKGLEKNTESGLERLYLLEIPLVVTEKQPFERPVK